MITSFSGESTGPLGGVGSVMDSRELPAGAMTLGRRAPLPASHAS